MVHTTLVVCCLCLHALCWPGGRGAQEGLLCAAWCPGPKHLNLGLDDTLRVGACVPRGWGKGGAGLLPVVLIPRAPL